MISLLTKVVLGFMLIVFMPLMVNAGSRPEPGTFDHLKCFNVKDDSKIDKEDSTHFLQPQQFPQFGDEDCTIIGKGFRFFCVPVSKDGEVSGTPILQAFDQVCYRIERCTDRGAASDTVDVSDQFGPRTLEILNPHMVCTPARKCNSLCPPGSEDEVGCTPPSQPSAPGVCNENCQCIPAPCGITSPACNGACPPFEVCEGGQSCQCVDQTCGGPGGDQCGGTCPPGLSCIGVGTFGACICSNL